MKLTIIIFTTTVLFFFLGTTKIFAQEDFDDHYMSVEINKGVAHYFGELASESRFGIASDRAGFVFGGGVSKQIKPKIAVRVNGYWARIRGDDQKAFAAGSTLYNRGLHFQNDIIEVSVTGQYYFFKNKGHYSERPFWNPYVFGGIAAFYHNPKARSPEKFGDILIPLRELKTEGQSKPYSNFGMSIPYGIGMNFKISEQFDLGIEIGLRKTFTDYLDDTSGNYAGNTFGDNELAYILADPTKSFPEGTKRGDSFKNDGYMFTTFKLKYILSKNKKTEELSRIHRINSETLVKRRGDARKSGIDFHKYEDRYSIENLAINTKYAELQPSFYQGGILFTTNNPDKKRFLKKNRVARHNLFNFFYAPIHDLYRNELTKPVHIQDEKYAHYHHFTAASTDNGQKVLLTLYKRQDGSADIHTQQLYTAEVAGENVWVNVKALPFNSTDFSITHPTISADGTTIYFSSDKEGGIGGTDIYVSYKYRGNWTYPINVGTPVNTEGNEMFPFIHQDGTLYFSSDGHESMGGLDIYEATAKGESFERVANLGAPINSEADDFALILDDVKRTGFFTSNRKGGKGNDDIYKLTVESINRSRKLTDESDALFSIMKLNLKGKVINKTSGLPIAKAIVKLRDILNDELRISRTNKYGEFSFPISNDAIYEVGSTIRGYHPMNNKKVSTVGISEQEDIQVILEANPLTYRIIIKGIVKAKTTDGEEVDSILPGAEVVVLDLQDDSQQSIIADENGAYKVTLTSNRDYILFVSEKGYKPKEVNISTYNKRSSETRILNIALESKE